MQLRQLDALALEVAVDRPRGGDGDLGRGLLRLDERAAAVALQPGGGELLGVAGGEQAGLDPDAALGEQLAEFAPALLGDVERAAVGQLAPAADLLEALRYVAAGDPQTGGEGELDVGDRLADGGNGGVDVVGVQALGAVVTSYVDVHRAHTGLHRLLGVARELLGRDRDAVVR